MDLLFTLLADLLGFVLEIVPLLFLRPPRRRWHYGWILPLVGLAGVIIGYVMCFFLPVFITWGPARVFFLVAMPLLAGGLALLVRRIRRALGKMPRLGENFACAFVFALGLMIPRYYIAKERSSHSVQAEMARDLFAIADVARKSDSGKEAERRGVEALERFMHKYGGAENTPDRPETPE